MTVLVDTSPSTSHQSPLPALLRGRTRYAAAALLVVGALLDLASFLVESTPSTNRAQVAAWADDAGRTPWGAILAVLAPAFLLGGFLVIAAMTFPTSRRFAVTGFAGATLGMTGLAIVVGFEMAARAAAVNGDRHTAVTILDGKGLGAALAVTLLVFLGGLLVAVVGNVVAMFRSPRIPRVAPVLLLAFVVLDNGLHVYVVSHSVLVLMELVIAWALVTGYVRNPRRRSEQTAH